MAETFNNNYNPDILSCIANLSNDEVFTPPEVANAMLDMLPQELFSNPDTKFLDPACKSGVFLREIAKRLLIGLKDVIPDLQQRVDHIFHHQLYGIAITELTSLLSRRSVYCSKYPNSKYSVSTFENADGNIRYKHIKHSWKNGKCVYCGASQTEYERSKAFESYAYEFIHKVKPEEILKMKFDVIISNPPYQLSDGGSGNGISAKPIYHLFIEQAEKLNPKYLIMIIPSRWFAGGKGLDKFRDKMLNSNHIQTLVDFPKSRECFSGVDIAGGVCYFLWARDKTNICKIITKINGNETTSIRALNEFNIFIRDNIGLKIINKIRILNEKTMNFVVLSRNPFGLVSSYRGENKTFNNAITLISSAGKGYINRNEIKKHNNLIETYKVIIGKINPDRGGVNNSSDGKINVITKIKILNPNTVCTETYLVLGTFQTKDEAQNCVSYYSTLFTRFLISLTLSSMNITKENFQFVPDQDFSKPWTDEELYKKYNLTNDEIAYIESIIRPMELGGDEDGD